MVMSPPHGDGRSGPETPEDRTKPLTRRRFARGLAVLGERDPDLSRILATIGPPPLRSRKPGFAALVHIILEQQVSLASAQAAFDRLLRDVPDLTPARFLSVDPDRLRRMGFSRQKALYCRGVASAIRDGALRLEGLRRMDDRRARDRLTAMKGIGRWTADVYLLSALRRPDVLPVGDLALRKAVKAVKALERPPTPEEFHALAAPWRPWRAVAARLLWHHYLHPSNR